MVHIDWHTGKKQLQHHYVNAVASTITFSRQGHAKWRICQGVGGWGCPLIPIQKSCHSPTEIGTYANESADAVRRIHAYWVHGSQTILSIITAMTVQ